MIRKIEKILLFLYTVFLYYYNNFISIFLIINKTFKYNPLFSIVVPTYNTDYNHLSKMIKSVKNQTYKNWELIVVDDCSSDKNLTPFIQNFIENDNRIKLFSNERNLGICQTTQIGIDHSKGDYILFLDHDDLLKNSALMIILNFIQDDIKPDLLYTDEEYIYSHSFKKFIFRKNPFSLNRLIANNYICHITIVRFEFLKKIGGYRIGFDGSQDHEFILRASQLANKIQYIPHSLYKWRIHKKSFSNQKIDQCKSSSMTAIRETLSRYDLSIKRLEEGYFPFSYHCSLENKWKSIIIIIIHKELKYSNNIKKILNSINKELTISSFTTIIKVIINLSTTSLEFDIDEQIIINPSTNIPYVINNIIKKYNTDLTFIISTDSVIQKNSLNELIQSSNFPSTGIVTSRIENETKKILSKGLVLGWNGFLEPISYKLKNKIKMPEFGNYYLEHDLSASIYNGSLYVNHILKSNGYFPEEYDLLFWDIDYSINIVKNHYKILYNPYSVLVTNNNEIFKYFTINNRSITDDHKKLYRKFKEELFHDRNYSTSSDLLLFYGFPKFPFHDFIWNYKNQKIVNLLEKA
jgi:O-antigen biosynthesis protein